MLTCCPLRAFTTGAHPSVLAMSTPTCRMQHGMSACMSQSTQVYQMHLPYGMLGTFNEGDGRDAGQFWALFSAAGNHMVPTLLQPPGQLSHQRTLVYQQTMFVYSGTAQPPLNRKCRPNPSCFARRPTSRPMPRLAPMTTAGLACTVMLLCAHSAKRGGGAGRCVACILTPHHAGVLCREVPRRSRHHGCASGWQFSYSI